MTIKLSISDLCTILKIRIREYEQHSQESVNAGILDPQFQQGYLLALDNILEFLQGLRPSISEWTPAPPPTKKKGGIL